VKLLDITEFYSPQGGGVRTYLAAKAHWLGRQPDIEHVMVLSAGSDRLEQWGRTRVYLVGGPSVPASPGYHFLLSARKLGVILERERPDVVELGSLYLAPWLVRRAARGLRARLVAFLHEDTRAIYTGHALGWAPRVVRSFADRLVARYLTTALRGCDLAVAATAAGARTLAALGVAETAVVPLGVDTTLFRPDVRDPTWKSAVGASPDQPVALYVGRLSTGKCLRIVLAALPEIHAATGLRLVLIGEGHQRRWLEGWGRAHRGMLSVLPYEPDRRRLARAYASADLCIAPGPYETFGLAAVEAMASGLPVVGVRAGAIGELLQGADWGVTYRAGDLGDCARALHAALAAGPGPGVRARAVALDRYSWERTFTELVRLYERLVHARPSPSRASRMPASPTQSISV
jgi:alpha-1,6-mannosyltransferase